MTNSKGGPLPFAGKLSDDDLEELSFHAGWRVALPKEDRR